MEGTIRCCNNYNFVFFSTGTITLRNNIAINVAFFFNFNYVIVLIINVLILRKFDIGVYTLITSIDPLVVYIYEEEILLRYINSSPIFVSLHTWFCFKH